MTVCENMIKHAIRDRVVRDFPPMKVHRTKIESKIDEDGDELLLIHVWLRKTDRKLPKDFFYNLRTALDDAVWNTGEKRFPIFFPHLAKGQKLAFKVSVYKR